MKNFLREFSLNTVCEEARCPNIAECFERRTATFLILGDICTRRCGFCSVKKGKPRPVDSGEPERISKAAKKLGLKYVVITSPTRDDLADGGAEIFYASVRELKKINLNIRVEILVPDFNGRKEAISRVAQSGAEVIAHNLETVPRFYQQARSGASYSRSLEVLKLIKQLSGAHTKSGIMLGMGETRAEIKTVMADLVRANCDFLTLGQYLPPSAHHYPVKEYVTPERFADLKKVAGNYGFKSVQSAPYTRSSYNAEIAGVA